MKIQGLCKQNGNNPSTHSFDWLSAFYDWLCLVTHNFHVQGGQTNYLLLKMSLRCGWLVHSAMEWITKSLKSNFLGHIWTATSGPGSPMVPPYIKKKQHTTKAPIKEQDDWHEANDDPKVT